MSDSAARVTHLPPLCDRAYRRNRHVSVTNCAIRPQASPAQAPRRPEPHDDRQRAPRLGGRRPRLRAARARAAWPRRTRSGRRSPCRARRATTSRSTTPSRLREPGEVIVLAVGGETGTAHCGDIVALAARERGVAGIVVDGAVARPRAARGARRAGLPPSAPRRAGRRKAGPGALRVPVTLAGVDGAARRHRLRRRRRHRRRRRPPTPTRCLRPPRRSRNASASIVAAHRARRDDRRHLRPEGARVKIARIEATPLAIPLAQEFHWAGGAQVGANLVLFAVHTDDGVVGYGESICEDPRAVVAHGELMARQLVGRSPGDMEAILRSIWSEGRWKMWPQFTQTRLRRDRGRLLGRARPGARRADAHVLRRRRPRRARLLRLPPGRRPRHARAPRAAARRRGLPRHLPEGRPRRRRATTTRCVAAVREAIGPEPLLRIDPNEAWDLATAVDRIRRLEQYDLDWVEQPVPAAGRRRARARAPLGRRRRSPPTRPCSRPASSARCSRRRRPT